MTLSGARELSHALEVCAGSAAGSLFGGLAGSGAVRVGVDVVLVSEVLDSVNAFGARYLERIFTDRELSDCRADAGSEVSASRLAARFAAKEAVTKVLAPRDAPGWWRDIEVVRLRSGACELSLHGGAAHAAEQLQLDGWGVSLTHEGSYAAAVVVARSDSAQTQQALPEVDA